LSRLAQGARKETGRRKPPPSKSGFNQSKTDCFRPYLVLRENGRASKRGARDPTIQHSEKETVLGDSPKMSRYWYHANSPTIRLNESEKLAFSKHFVCGELRIGYGSMAVHQSQSSGCEALPRSCWPRISGKPAWPSSPNLNEFLDMSRRGIKNCSRDVRVGGSFASIQLSEFNSNIELAKRVISRNVLGIRSDVKVPEKFWKFFCYRWNFLILSVHGKMPAGLARFLASVWITNPYSLWLERRVTLKQYLRELPLSVYNRGVAAFAEHQSDWYSSADSTFTSCACSVSSSQLD
jgi:hypothetical protein